MFGNRRRRFQISSTTESSCSTNSFFFFQFKFCFYKNETERDILFLNRGGLSRILLYHATVLYWRHPHSRALRQRFHFVVRDEAPDAVRARTTGGDDEGLLRHSLVARVLVQFMLFRNMKARGTSAHVRALDALTL